MSEHLQNTLNLFFIFLCSTLFVMGPIGLAALLESKGYNKLSCLVGGGWMLFLVFLICFMLAK